MTSTLLTETGRARESAVPSAGAAHKWKVVPLGDEAVQAAEISKQDRGVDGWEADEVGSFVARPGHFGWAVKRGGRVLAVMLVEVRAEARDDGEYGDCRVHLLAVRDGHEGVGLASALVLALKEQLADMRLRHADVLVREADTASQVFYRDLGFRYDKAWQDQRAARLSLYRLRCPRTPELRAT